MFSGKRIALPHTVTLATFIPSASFGVSSNAKCLEFHVLPPFAKAIVGSMCNQAASVFFCSIAINVLQVMFPFL